MYGRFTSIWLIFKVNQDKYAMRMLWGSVDEIGFNKHTHPAVFQSRGDAIWSVVM